MNKNITLVTGGSSGLGLEIARIHLLNGDNVCIVGRSQKRLDSAAKDLKPSGASGELMAMSCNVAEENEVAGVFAEISRHRFEVKAVYNVAGIGIYSEPNNVTREMVDQLLEANLIGLILMSTHALQAMNEKGGVLVNVMSSAAKKADPMGAAYCAVKWGARGYTESLAAALKGSAIRVLAVYPSGMNTPFWARNTGQVVDGSKFMDPKEVAEVICSVVKNRNSLNVTELSIERK